jgi:hypothetical protein
MIPTNRDNNEGCSPISSNCVIWQGPDIPCINLCKGDSVSDVVAKLAEELCTLLGQLSIDAYDLNCLKGVCPAPQNIQELIQLLIDKYCECCEPSSTGPTQVKTLSNCPDNCYVTIAPCFQYINGTGDLVTSMLLSDYVKAIGVRVCSIVSQIQTINLTLLDHETRITYIENNCCNPPTPQEIYILNSCLLGTNPPDGWLIQTVLTNLETAFCNLQNATGTPSQILNAITYQCPNLNLQESFTYPGVNMGSLPGWVLAPSNLSQSFINMWITICDMRAIITTLQDCCQERACPPPVLFNTIASY